jgi:hypothetical protein
VPIAVALSRSFGNLPPALWAALLVFCIVYFWSAQRALKADLKPSTPTRKSWHHFALNTAYLVVALVFAAIVWFVARWTQ